MNKKIIIEEKGYKNVYSVHYERILPYTKTPLRIISCLNPRIFTIWKFLSQDIKLIYLECKDRIIPLKYDDIINLYNIHINNEVKLDSKIEKIDKFINILNKEKNKLILK